MTDSDASEIIAHAYELWPKIEWTSATQDAFFRRLSSLTIPLDRAKAVLERIRMASKWPTVEPGELWPSLLAESQSAANVTPAQPTAAKAPPKSGRGGALAVMAIADGTSPNHSARASAACRAEVERAKAANEQPNPHRVVAALTKGTA